MMNVLMKHVHRSSVLFMEVELGAYVVSINRMITVVTYASDILSRYIKARF